MSKQTAARKAALGLDVGKSSHWTRLVTGEGEVRENRHPQSRIGRDVQPGAPSEMPLPRPICVRWTSHGHC